MVLEDFGKLGKISAATRVTTQVTMNKLLRSLEDTGNRENLGKGEK